MNNRVVLSFAWLTATVVMMVVTYSAVNLVGSQVTDQPIQADRSVDTTIADRVSVETSTTTTTTSQPASTTSAPDIPIPSVTTASSVVDPSAPTTSTSSTSTSTTSTSAPDPELEVTGPFPVSSGGGVITVSCIGDEISFLGATPSAGYSMQIDDHGPDRVKVQFSSTENEWDLEVRCRAGAIDPKVELDSLD